MSNDDIKFDVIDTPEETVTEDPDTTYIVHRVEGKPDVRMPMTDWADYAKRNGL